MKKTNTVEKYLTQRPVTVPLSADIYVSKKEIIIKDKGNVMTHKLHLSKDVAVPIKIHRPWRLRSSKRNCACRDGGFGLL